MAKKKKAVKNARGARVSDARMMSGWEWSETENARIHKLMDILKAQGILKPTAQMILDLDRKIDGTLLQRFKVQPRKVHKKIQNVLRSVTTGLSYKKKVIEAATKAAESTCAPTSLPTDKLDVSEALIHHEKIGLGCDKCAVRDVAHKALCVHAEKMRVDIIALQSEVVRLKGLLVAPTKKRRHLAPAKSTGATDALQGIDAANGDAGKS